MGKGSPGGGGGGGVLRYHMRGPPLCSHRAGKHGGGGGGGGYRCVKVAQGGRGTQSRKGYQHPPATELWLSQANIAKTQGLSCHNKCP